MGINNMGVFIAQLRKEKNMTQKELADCLNITNKAVSKWERGDGYPEISVMPALAEVLCVSIDELFKGRKEKTDQKSSIKESTDRNQKEQAEFFLSSSYQKLKNINLLFAGLAVIALICFFTITLCTYYEKLGFGIQLAVLTTGIFFYLVTFNNFKNSCDKSLKIYEHKDIYEKKLKQAVKFLNTAVYILLINIALSLPYIVFDSSPFTKSIITSRTYFNVIIIFLITGFIAGYYINILINRHIEKSWNINVKTNKNNKLKLKEIRNINIISIVHFLFLTGLVLIDTSIKIYKRHTIQFIVLTVIIVYFILLLYYIIKSQKKNFCLLAMCIALRNLTVSFFEFRLLASCCFSFIGSSNINFYYDNFIFGLIGLLIYLLFNILIKIFFKKAN